MLLARARPGGAAGAIRGVRGSGVLRGARGVPGAVLLLAAALAACGGPASPPASEDPPPAFEKGIVFGLFARSQPAYARRALGEIRALGANAISIMVPWVTPAVRSTAMAPRDDMTPSDRSLRRAIGVARSLGLRVLLMPFLYVDRVAEGEWRGTISPEDWSAWFENYRRFILHYAALAGEEGVQTFSVGSELCSAEGRREEWIGLIDAVRRLYAGRVIYSANWDHLEALAFADRLDAVGMNAYFEVGGGAGRGSPTVEELVESWGPIIESVEAWRRALGKDLIITEVGYPSRRGACADPWNHAVSRDPAPEEQYRCYQAFREAWGGGRGLGGVYFYLWWGEGGPGDTGYTPRGKPAEAVVREWFSRENPRVEP